MIPERRSMQVAAMGLCLAVVVRLAGSGVLSRVMTQPHMLSAIVLAETGRRVTMTETQHVTQPTAPPTQPPETTAPTSAPTSAPPVTTAPPPTEPVKATFCADDTSLVAVNSVCGYDVDVASMLGAPLSWDLTQSEPAVLFVHSHATESYTKTEDYTESGDYRTLDTDYNVVSVGTRIAQILEAGGVKVIHDTTLHDYPSYNSSYAEARESIARYMDAYPEIRMVLDIHRDAVETSDGRQLRYTVESGGQSVAQVMMVVGTDAGGLQHPNWQRNMALAVKLHAQLEKTTPGICRPISFRKQRFNQDMSPGAMLIEIGAAGNTRGEALAGAQRVAEAILALSHGTGDMLY